MGYPFIIVIMEVYHRYIPIHGERQWIVQWDDSGGEKSTNLTRPGKYTKSGLENSHVIVDLPIKNCDFL
jgi:hypothetical protein